MRIESETADAATTVVSDGAHTAAITLLGQFMANAFHPGPDAGLGTVKVISTGAGAGAP